MRTAFLIDGFNLYHSVRDVIAEKLGGPELKWLDIPGLCEGIVRDCPEMPREAFVSEVRYFTAYAKHMEAHSPGIVRRHEAFVAAQEARGALVHIGEFKKTSKGHEEKETDVAIGVALLEAFFTDAADCVFIMSGDTDLMPAVRSARRLFPARRICFAFPYRRQNNVLRDAADVHFRIRAHRYGKHVLPDPVMGKNGPIHCPASWRPSVATI